MWGRGPQAAEVLLGEPADLVEHLRVAAGLAGGLALGVHGGFEVDDEVRSLFEDFRSIEVELEPSGLEAKTWRGYYP